jgi:glycerol-3-phosphate cytidylyltransferase-like family protein
LFDDDKEVVRIFMDGAFDMMHYGHMNAFRKGGAFEAVEIS